MHDCADMKGQTGIWALVIPPALSTSFLAWQPFTCAPTCINPVCVLLPAGYVLWWQVSDVESSREERSLSNSTLQHQVTGLTSTTSYRLQVAALTAAGRGVVTSSTISTGVPPGTMNAYEHVLV